MNNNGDNEDDNDFDEEDNDIITEHINYYRSNSFSWRDIAGILNITIIMFQIMLDRNVILNYAKLRVIPLNSNCII